MDAETTAAERTRAYLRPRLRIVGGAFVVGAVAGIVLVGVLVLVAGWAVVESARFTFALGTLAFGFALLGWSGSVMAGRGFEAMQEHLDAGTNWTERDSRRAMARVGGFGAGMVLATGVFEAAALAT